MALDLKSRIEAAAGRRPADLVLRGGRIVNVYSREILTGDVAISEDRIVGVGEPYDGKEIVELDGKFLCPGFIDGHVHIESSLLSVPEYARLVASHGTAAVVTDPHEIANVMGAEGIRFMLASSKYCPIHVFFTMSSCVPASPFETAGAELSALDIEPLLKDRWVVGLAEMMNYPGVVNGDEDCLAKLQIVDRLTIDGHAPELTGKELNAYIAAGIGSDHECITLEEAREKLRLGLHIMIREGSQAKNLDALLPLVNDENADRFMFVTDDKDVEDLLGEGHIDHIVRRAVAGGLDPLLAIRLATLHPARYFGLDHLGAIAPGKTASLCVLEDLKDFRVTEVYHAGQRLDAGGSPETPVEEKRRPLPLRSSINVRWLELDQFPIPAPGDGDHEVHVIEVLEDRIDTGHGKATLTAQNGVLLPDPARDLAKIAVIERHRATGNTGLGFVRGFGLKAGAIASSVGHDSHNLVVAATNDEDLFAAAVHLVKIQGGFCAVRDGEVLADVPLPIGGLMSNASAETLAAELEALHDATRSLGGSLRRPFMALSFLTLSVIGALKLTDQGLVKVDEFKLIDVFAKS